MSHSTSAGSPASDSTTSIPLSVRWLSRAASACRQKLGHCGHPGTNIQGQRARVGRAKRVGGQPGPRQQLLHQLPADPARAGFRTHKTLGQEGDCAAHNHGRKADQPPFLLRHDDLAGGQFVFDYGGYAAPRRVCAMPLVGVQMS